ncbi:MAG: tRNA preQ1(34) S-adenosylmethionine ribosyltransferase-isomerase QueA [Thermodesulfovibrionales bacterium]|nr:tRNA preQ1(34) S-adenosylmethionine ribosyltransferase-isomerase QueA [Thermodesulfovibrionales bacterium]
MKKTDFDFYIPSESIALRPQKDRDYSRLLITDRAGRIEHSVFNKIGDYINKGDLLIMNDSKVIPVRLIVKKPSGGRLDLILVKELSEYKWEILCKGNYKGKIFIADYIEAYIDFDDKESVKTLTIHNPIKDILSKHGLMPLPPYIKRLPDEQDKIDYQTVYAEKDGSIAAPTAGLHFTHQLIYELKNKGVEIETITLHVGKGTFMPIKSLDISLHKMLDEQFEIKKTLIEKIIEYKKEKRRIIAVGTTTTRTLEGYFSEKYNLISSQNGSIRGWTDLFIYPGFQFNVLGGLITNFHLPCSTPLVLVSAFLGLEQTRRVYQIAIEKGYRFFSYGDAMLIL